MVKVDFKTKNIYLITFISMFLLVNLSCSDIIKFRGDFLKDKTISTNQDSKLESDLKLLEANFSIKELGIVDILLLIDNSGSMQEELGQLADKFSSITDAFKSSDWRIAIMPGIRSSESDENECSNIKVFNKGVDDVGKIKEAINYFRDNPSTTGRQQIFRQIMTAISTCSTNWLRDKSDIAIVIVSDEDNCNYNNSEDYDKICPLGTPGRKASDLHQAIVENITSKDSSRKVKFFGFFEHPNKQVCEHAAIARQIAKFVDMTDTNNSSYDIYSSYSSHIWGDICADDYTDTINKISESIGQNILYRFDLKAKLDMSENGKKFFEVILIRSDGTEDKLEDLSKILIKGSIIEFADKDMLKGYARIKVKFKI